MHNLERKTDPLGNQTSSPLIGEMSAFGLGRAFARGAFSTEFNGNARAGTFSANVIIRTWDWRSRVQRLEFRLCGAAFGSRPVSCLAPCVWAITLAARGGLGMARKLMEIVETNAPESDLQRAS